MKVIFLDIDGVLNSDDYFLQRHDDDRLNPHGYPLSEFDPYPVKLLNNLTDLTGAKIVLSSDWRKDASLQQLKNLFEKVGITGELIGKTPILRNNRLYGETIRGDEVSKWLADTHYKVESYIIIDDNNDFGMDQQKQFIKTNGITGFTKKDYELALLRL